MESKIIKACLIVLQVVITASLVLGNICAIATIGENNNEVKALIESLIRCLAVLAFTIFYYSSVSDSFSSESLLFPLYLFFLSTSEIRILEKVESSLNFFIIPNQLTVGVLVFSSFAIAFCLIGYAMLQRSSKGETSLYTFVSLTASAAIVYFAPIAQEVSQTWSSKSLFYLNTFFFAAGIFVSIVQTLSESLNSSRMKYIICILLLANTYINLVFDTVFMNFVGTVLFIFSLVLAILLVRINSTKL